MTSRYHVLFIELNDVMTFIFLLEHWVYAFIIVNIHSFFFFFDFKEGEKTQQCLQLVLYVVGTRTYIVHLIQKLFNKGSSKIREYFLFSKFANYS